MIDKHDGLEPVNPGEILGRWAGRERRAWAPLDAGFSRRIINGGGGL